MTDPYDVLAAILERATDEPGQTVTSLQQCINDIGRMAMAALGEHADQ